MMADHLNVGKGRCHGTAQLLLKPVKAVIELGAAPDFMQKVLNAVHHANRQGPTDDFIAVALPTIRKGRYALIQGTEVELFGSTVALSAFMCLEGVLSLKNRGMVDCLEVMDVFAGLGDIGAAYVRDRACEKHTSGWIRRSKARAERRGKALGKSVKLRTDNTSALILKYGETVLHVREVLAVISDAPLMVNTYGFSTAGEPAVLPVAPENSAGLSNAT
jgi:hypothetical protein